MKLKAKTLAVLVVICLCTLGALRAISQEMRAADTRRPATRASLSQIAAQMKKMLTSGSSAHVPGPGVHQYFITKTQARVGVKTSDGKDLLRADFSETGKIVSVRWAVCTGPQGSCGHTYPCDVATCGHDNIEITGNTAIWWAKTDDGNDNLYTFDVSHQ